MTTYERLISELGDGLGIALSPDSAGLTEVFVEDRAVLVRADETGERELTIFTVLATAPEEGFSSAALQRALEMNLFGREVVGHHLGLFADSLILSSALPLEDLSAEALADRWRNSRPRRLPIAWWRLCTSQERSRNRFRSTSRPRPKRRTRRCPRRSWPSSPSESERKEKS